MQRHCIAEKKLSGTAGAERAFCASRVVGAKMDVSSKQKIRAN
jgi:hypothetical protein